MAGLVVYRFYPVVFAAVRRRMGYAALDGGDPGKAVELEGGNGSAGGEKDVGADPSAYSPNVSGATPIRGMHAHMTKGYGKGGNAASKANSLADARAQQQHSVNTGAPARARGDSQ
jgi:hypothetical protein